MGCVALAKLCQCFNTKARRACPERSEWVTKVTETRLFTLSHEIIGAAIEVHRWLGPGLLESVYEAALCKELRLRGMTIDRQVTLPVTYKGEVLDCCLKLDLLVNNNIIVEVKSVEKLLSVHKSHNC